MLYFIISNYYLEVPLDGRNNLTYSDDDEPFVECQSSFSDLSARFAVNATVVHDSDEFDVNKTIKIEPNDTLTLDSVGVDEKSAEFKPSPTLPGVSDKTFDTNQPDVSGVQEVHQGDKTFDTTQQEASGVKEEPPKLPGPSVVVTAAEEIPDTSASEIESREVREFEEIEKREADLHETEAANEPTERENLAEPEAEVSYRNIDESFHASADKTLNAEEQQAAELLPSPVDGQPQPSDEFPSAVEELASPSPVNEPASPSVGANFPLTPTADNFPLPWAGERFPTSAAGRKFASPPVGKKFPSSPVAEHFPTRPVGEQVVNKILSPLSVDPQFPSSSEAREVPSSSEVPQSSFEHSFEASKSASPAVAQFQPPAVFVEKMESRLDVQFKVPAAPVFKQPDLGLKDEDFGTCGSSCKNSIKTTTTKALSLIHKSAFTNTTMRWFDGVACKQSRVGVCVGCVLRRRKKKLFVDVTFLNNFGERRNFLCPRVDERLFPCEIDKREVHPRSISV